MYDYVIVGAGSAGCVLAARLTRGPGRQRPAARGRAAGRQREHPRPARLPAARRGPRSTGTTAPRRSRTATAAASRCRAARCSAAPPRSTRWSTSAATAATTTTGASPAGPGTTCLPYFLKAEDNERGASRVARRRRAAAGLRAALAATASRPPSSRPASRPGWPRNEDFNGAEQDGVGMYQVTQRGGMRASAAVAYLHPAMERPNLTVMPYMHVNRVLFEGTRAVGVEASAARPGAGAARRARGDPLRRRLQLAAAADALRRRPGRAPDDARGRGAARPAGGRREPQRPRRPRYGVWTTPEPESLLLGARAGGAGGVRGHADRPVRLQPRRGRRLRPGRGRAPPAPDIQFHVVPVQIVDEGIARPARRHGVWVSPCLLTPESRGSGAARLQRPDRASRSIRNDFYSAERRHGADDRRAAADAGDLRASRRCAATAPSRSTVPDGDSDEALRAHVARTTFPIYHPVGTCAIGSVVDDRAARRRPRGRCASSTPR